MRALCWHAKGDVRVDTVPDPKIQHPRDAISRSPPAQSVGIRSAICSMATPTRSAAIPQARKHGRGDRVGA